MKAKRFQLSALRLGAMAAIVILVSGVSLAQVALPAPNANTQFGRLSWYTSVTNFDKVFSGSLAFGVYGQANDATTANPNGHGSKLGFGIFGYTGNNGLFGGAGHSMVNGAGRNTGFWALASNTTSPLLSHTSADTANTLAIGLQVGAQAGRGLAIMVDSGDVWLAAAGNTTTVQNLQINGTVSGLTGNNKFTQDITAGTVAIGPSVNAGIEVQMTTASGANADPAIWANQSASATGMLLRLTKDSLDAFTVGNTGDLAINTNKFTVAAATGNTQIAGTANVDGNFSVNTDKFTVATADGSVSVKGPGAGPVFNVNGASGATTISDATTSGTYSLSVTNSLGGATGGKAASFVGSNRAEYSVNMRSDGNRTTFAIPTTAITDGSASLLVTRGAVIDTLDITGHLQFGTTTTKATVDFSNATVTGFAGNNRFEQDNTGDPVQISASTNAGVEIQMTAATSPNANSNPALLANVSTAATGKLLDLQKNAVSVFTVGNTGDLTVGASKFTVAAATGNTVVAGWLDAQAYITNNTGAYVTVSDSLDVSGGVQVGGGTFVANKSGQTTIADATTTGAYSLSVTNSLGGATGGKAATFTGSNRNEYGTSVKSDGNRVSFVRPTDITGGVINGGSAALVVQRAAVIDTLDVAGHMEFGTNTAKATVDFTNAIVTGLISNDSTKVDFQTGATQNNWGNNNSIDITDKGTGTTILVDKTGATGDILNLKDGGGSVVKVVNGGMTTITPNVTGDALTATANAAGGNGVVATGTGATNFGVKAIGTGGAKALYLDGAVATNGTTNQPAGSASGTILQGYRTVSITVANTLVTASSNIIVSVTSAAADSYVATVTARTPATGFTVKVTDVEGDVPEAAGQAVDVHYWIVN